MALKWYAVMAHNNTECILWMKIPEETDKESLIPGI